MNELKPEDVMRALECCSKSNGVDACMSGCPLWEMDTCPCVEDEAALMKSALALLREKDAEIKELTDDNKWSAKRIIETDKLVSLLKSEVERLNKAIQNFAELENGYIVTGYKNIRAEAITEFAERLKKEVNGNKFSTYRGTEVRKVIDQIAKEMNEEKQ